jgi:PHD/YefM family antitoxin component YafN of YafNO toxin-antitoxin module
MPKLPGINIKDIRSVTDFQRNARTHVARLRKTKAPMVLTVNGSAAIVVQDAATYQQLVDRVENLEYERDFVAAVNEGIAAAERGDVYPAREALEKLGRELGF